MLWFCGLERSSILQGAYRHEAVQAGLVSCRKTSGVIQASRSILVLMLQHQYYPVRSSFWHPKHYQELDPSLNSGLCRHWSDTAEWSS